jgi:hypothetical protein
MEIANLEKEVEGIKSPNIFTPIKVDDLHSFTGRGLKGLYCPQTMDLLPNILT